VVDALIWVQSDEREAGRRSLARAEKPDALDSANMPADGSPPVNGEWMAEEIPFNAAQRTWERADVIVCGTPQIPCDPVTEIVVAPPLAPDQNLRKSGRLSCHNTSTTLPMMLEPLIGPQ